MQEQVERVVIGMDPHNRSATIEVMTGDETVLGGGRFDTSQAGFAAMVDYVNGIQPDPERRVWAVEGCNGIGHHLAIRLLAGSEQVLDVPPNLSARARVFATGQGRKTDATDAHSVALVATRMAGLRPVVDDEQLAVLRVLVYRRRSLVEDHTRIVSQVHALLLEQIPATPSATCPQRKPRGCSPACDPATPRRGRQDPTPPLRLQLPDAFLGRLLRLERREVWSRFAVALNIHD